MPDDIEQTYTTDYGSSLQHALQQKRSKLMETMTMPEGKLRGEKKRTVERLEPQEAERITTKHGKSNPRVQTFEQRWVSGHRYRDQRILDKADKLQRLADPSSEMVQASRFSLQRAADRQEIIPAFFGTAYTGEEGNTAETFSTASGYNVTAGGNSSTNYLAAYREGLQLLEDREVDLAEEPVFALINPAIKRVLFGDAQILSADYHPRTGIVESYTLPMMYGINWIVHTAMSELVSGKYEFPLWTKSAMFYGEWDELETFVERRGDHNHDWMMSAYHWMGATRQDHKRIVKIKLPTP